MKAGLRDVRVLDLSIGIAGAYATKLFADAGADVVKVGAVGEPPLARFLGAGKRVAERATPALLGAADLIVCNEELPPHALAPQQVLLSITPWGRAGPMQGRPWTEFVLQAESGSIGTRGLPGQEPFQAGGRITEWIGGTYAGVAALAALHRARRTGHGERIDFSLFEAITLAGTNYMDLNFRLLAGPPDPEKLGGLPQSVETPSIEPTRDGYVVVAAGSQAIWLRLCAAIERPDLAADPRFSDNPKRVENREALERILEPIFRARETAAWLALLQARDIPATPVNDLAAALALPPLAERAMVGPSLVGSPIARGRAPRPAPRLGEHADEL